MWSLLLSGLIATCCVAQHDTLSHVTVTPLGALWRSAVVPGWGQLYYGSPLRAVLFFGATGVVTGIVVWNNSRYIDADRRYVSYDSTDGRKAFALREREFYRDQRDIAALWLVAIYCLNLMDAYVGGHLASFTLGETAQLQFIPNNRQLHILLRW